MKKFSRYICKMIIEVKFNTWLLLLILMMMFGEYSHRYYDRAMWGISWHIEKIAPIVYYASGILAIVIVVILIIVSAIKAFSIIRGKKWQE